MAVQLACREGSARLEVRGIRAREEWGPQTGKGSPGGRGEGTHLKHVFHVLDAGEVEVQRLVELFRALPSRKGGHTKQDGVLAGRREGGGRGGGASRTQGSRSAGGRVDEGTRTLNISFMLVTLDVSNFSSQLNFFAFCRVARERSYEAGWDTGWEAREGGGRGGGASRTQGSRSAGGSGRGHAP